MHKIKIHSRALSHICKGQKERGKSLRHDVEFYVPTKIVSVTSQNILSSFVITCLDEMSLT